MTVAPAAILRVDNALTARSDRPRSYVFLGIVGDAQHSFGYHLSPNQLRANGLPGDYSLTLVRDKAGASKYPDDASAWDLGFSPVDMLTVTKRLLAAAKAKDPRMKAVREFCGTTDNQRTHNYDLSNGHEGLNEWDDSHLTHVHISFYRDVSNDFEALAGVLGVICGEDDDMALSPDVEKRFDDIDRLLRLIINGDPPGTPAGKRHNIESLTSLRADIEALKAKP